jgi:hypothetical protein
MNDLKRRVTALEKKLKERESQKKWQEKNKDKMKEYRQKYEDKHPERKDYYRSKEWHEIRRERYKENPEQVMRQRLNCAANLLYKHGLIDGTELERIKRIV